MLDQKIELMQRVPLFRGLTRRQLRAIARASRKVFFEAGEGIVAIDESGDTSYMIVTGKAECPHMASGCALEEDLGPGTMISELAMLVDTVHNFSVIAKQRLRALALQRDDFRAVMEADLTIAEHISVNLLMRLSKLAADLRRVDSRLEDIERPAGPEPSFYARSPVPSVSAVYEKWDGHDGTARFLRNTQPEAAPSTRKIVGFTRYGAANDARSR